MNLVERRYWEECLISCGFFPPPKAIFCLAATPTTVNTDPFTSHPFRSHFGQGTSRRRIVAQHDHIRSTILVALGEEAAFLQIEITHILRARRVPFQNSALHTLGRYFIAVLPIRRLLSVYCNAGDTATTCGSHAWPSHRRR